MRFQPTPPIGGAAEARAVRLSPTIPEDQARAPYSRQTDLKGGGLSPALLIVLADCRARSRSQRGTIARARSLALTCSQSARPARITAVTLAKPSNRLTLAAKPPSVSNSTAYGEAEGEAPPPKACGGSERATLKRSRSRATSARSAKRADCGISAKPSAPRQLGRRVKRVRPRAEACAAADERKKARCGWSAG